MKKSELRNIINEEIQSLTEDFAKVAKARKALISAEVPYSFRKDKIGNHSVFLKSSNVDPAIKKLKADGWKGGMKKNAPASGAVTYSFKKDNNELEIYVGGYDSPEVSFR